MYDVFHGDDKLYMGVVAYIFDGLFIRMGILSTFDWNQSDGMKDDDRSDGMKDDEWP